jgi:hypothetical protein
MYIAHQENASVCFYTLLLKQSVPLQYGTDRVFRNVGTIKVQATLLKIPEKRWPKPE